MSTPLSKFYAVGDRPVAVVPLADGGTDCVVFDAATGEMVSDRSYTEYLAPDSGTNVESLTQPEFEARLTRCRAAAGGHAVAQLRQWAEQLCATTGGPQEVAAALGFQGTLHRGAITVDPAPVGYAKLKISAVMTTGASMTLVATGRLLTREVFDAGLGAGSDVPPLHEGEPNQVAYHIDVAGAPATCTIFVGFVGTETPAAVEILLRRDMLRRDRSA